MSTHNSIEMQVFKRHDVKPSEVSLQATPASRAKASMKAASEPRAYMQYDPAEGSDGDKGYGLYGRVRGKTYKSRLLESKHEKTQVLGNQIEGIWKTGNALLKKYWDRSAHDVEISIGHLKMAFNGGKKIGQADFHGKIKELLLKKYPGASHLSINFSQSSIRFLNSKGEFEEVQKNDLPKEVIEILEFLNSWQSAHEAAMSIMGIRTWHSRLGISANRPIHGDIPFAVTGKTWESFIPKTDEEFVKNKHFEALLYKLPREAQENSGNNIQKTRSFIDTFKAKIETLIAERKAPENEMAQLKKIKADLEAINFYAVYWAICNWNSFDPADMTQENLSEKAQIITNGLLDTFNANRDLGKDKWSLNPLNYWHGKPEQDDLKSFAIQTGDLLFHSDLDYLTRFDSSGAKRMVRPCIEEFVVHNMMHLHAARYEDDLQSLNVELSPATQSALRHIIKEVRSEIN